MKKPKTDLDLLRRDLMDTETRMATLRNSYIATHFAGSVTRGRTTTYNARMGQWAERRDRLLKLIRAASNLNL